MSGVFKITKAEFLKIFKKPTVFIMAFVLVLACVLSLFLYSPAPRQDYRVQLSDENAVSNYNIFMSNVGSDTKENYDKNISSSDYKIQYFFNIKQREDDFFTSCDNLISALKSQDTKEPESIENITSEIDELISLYNKDYNLSEVPYFNYLTTLKNQNDETYYLNNIKFLQNLKYDVSTFSNAIDIATYVSTNDIITKIQNVYVEYINYIPHILNSVYIELEQTHQDYLIAVQQNSTQQSVQLTALQKTKLKALLNLLNSHKDIIDNVLNTDYPAALILKSNYESYLQTYTRIEKLLNISDTQLDKFSVRQQIAQDLSTDNYLVQIKQADNTLTFIDITDNQFIESLKDSQSLKDKNQAVLMAEIEELKNDTSTTNICNKITKYKLLSMTYNQIIDDKINQAITNDLSLSEIKNLYNYKFENYSNYELNERLSYNNYYLRTNTYSTDYLQVFAFNSNSDLKTNVYDYMYFALKICTLLIIIFTMFMVASIISSEQDNGTIKLLLIRPFSRGKILSAKLLATFFFSICFMLFCIIITFIGGTLTFGLPAISQVLLTFNATTTFTLHPAVVMLIFVISCILDIVFYLLVSAMLSVLFKSYVGAVTTSLLLIIIVTVLSAFLPNTIAYTFLPFTSISLFRFFGNSFLPTGTDVINLFFLTPISPFMSIFTSLIISTVFSIIVYIITFSVFKKRDF